MPFAKRRKVCRWDLPKMPLFLATKVFADMDNMLNFMRCLATPSFIAAAGVVDLEFWVYVYACVFVRV